MSDFCYANERAANLASQACEKTNILTNMESLLCDNLEGIETKFGFRILKAILFSIFAMITFDVISNGLLMDLLFKA